MYWAEEARRIAVTSNRGVAGRYVLCSCSRARLHGDVCRYMMLDSSRSALA